MDVRFDSNRAQQLLVAMRSYCTSIQSDAQDVLKLIDSAPQWKDPQYDQFCDAVKLICSDLDKALRLESDYANLFLERINELRS